MQRALFVTLIALTGCAGAETVVAPPSAPVRRQPSSASTQKFALARFESTKPAGAGESVTNAPVRATAPAAAPQPPSCSGWPRGTAVGVEETTRGAAMVFTSSDDLEALRARVADQRDAPTAEYTAHLDNVRRGIRVVYEPKAGDKDKLREAIELRARELSKACELAWKSVEEEPTEKPSRPEATPLRETTAPWISVEGDKIETKDKPAEAAKDDDKEDEKAEEKKADEAKGDEKKDDKKREDKKPEDDKKPGDKKPDDKKPDDKKPGDKKPGDKKPDEDKPAPPGDKPKDDEKPKDPFAPPAPKP